MHAMVMCQHNSLVMTVNAALGGETKGAPKGPVRNLADGHGSVDDAVAAINAAMMF